MAKKGENAWDYGAKGRCGRFYPRFSKGLTGAEGVLKHLEDEQAYVHQVWGREGLEEPQAVW